MNKNSLSSGTFIFLMIIIIVLLGCVLGFFCSRNTRVVKVQRPVENFDTNTRAQNFDDPNWRNNRFFQYDNIGRLVPTDPVHVDEEALSAALYDHDDMEQRFGNNEVSKKKDTINEGFVGGIFNVSKKNKSVQQEKADAVKKAAELDMPVGYDTPTDYSPITPGVNQGKNSYANRAQLENEIKNLEKRYQQITEKKEVEPMPQKAQNATVMPMAPIVDKDNLEKNVSLQCRFLGSEKCDPEFPNYSGASIKSADGMMSCNSPGEGQQEQATAVCAIAGGKIQSVYLLNKGKGYSAVPSVKLVGGNGSGCKLEAIVKNGSLQTIKILSKGQNYTSTPDIVIDKPSLNDTCYLCCK
jgi:hypothetical protein